MRTRDPRSAVVESDKPVGPHRVAVVEDADQDRDVLNDYLAAYDDYPARCGLSEERLLLSFRTIWRR
jgi:hypothetical protein